MGITGGVLTEGTLIHTTCNSLLRSAVERPVCVFVCVCVFMYMYMYVCVCVCTSHIATINIDAHPTPYHYNTIHSNTPHPRVLVGICILPPLHTPPTWYISQ